jgi:hypothetical protein
MRAVKPNSTGTETNSIFKDNWAISVKEEGGGPSSTTGFYSGIEPPVGGYTIYGPGSHIRVAADDSEFLFIIGKLGGDNSSVENALLWADGNPDVIVANRAAEEMVTDGLHSYFDFDSTISYPRTGNQARSLKGNNVAVLTNGASFSNGKIITDGSNDYIEIAQTGDLTTESWSFRFVARQDGYIPGGAQRRSFFGLSNGGDYAFKVLNWQIWDANNQYQSFIGDNVGYNSTSYYSQSTSEELKDYCLVITPTEVTYYEDGVEVQRVTQSQGYTKRGQFDRIWLGTRKNQYMNGEFYLFAAYDRELSPTEVMQNTREYKSRFNKDTISLDGLVTYIDPIYSKYRGSSSLGDISGVGNGATLHNVPAFRSNEASTYLFDGTNDYITVTDVPSGTKWSAFIWFKYDGQTQFANRGHRTFFATNTHRFQWDDNSSATSARGPFADFSTIGIGGATPRHNFTPGDLFGQWHCYGMTSDGSVIRTYTDGVELHSYTASRQFSTDGVMRIGVDGISLIGGADWLYETGGLTYVGPFIAYNRPLTPAEVQANFDAQKTRFGL